MLVAAVVEPHSFFLRARPWIEALRTGDVEGECSWHAAAETWAVLTRLPIEPAISPALADLAVARLAEMISPRALDAAVYRGAIRRCSERNLRSGAVFDALHLLSAESSRVDALVTFNPGDFERLSVESSPPIVVPPDPPSFTLG